MRKIVFLVIFSVNCALAQINNPVIRYVSIAPSGACTVGSVLQVVITTGIIYSCQNGVWGQVSGSGAGDVSSVFARTGDVVAASGDYAVAQVTGSAPLASPVFTGVVQADEVVANDFVGPLNGVAIGGNHPVAGNVLLATDPLHAVWGNNSPTGSGFWTSTDGVRDPAAHTIMPQDLPSTITSNTTGNSGTTAAFNHTPIPCSPVAGVTQYQTGTDAQGNSTGCSSPTGSGQPGSVTTITVDDIPELATTTVVNASTTPHVSYALLGTPAHSFFGNNTDTEGAIPAPSNITVADLPEEIAGIQAHNLFWASPDGTNGFPLFRHAVQADIPFAAPVVSPSFQGTVFTSGGTSRNFSTPDGGYCFGAVSESSTPVICLWSDNATNVHFGDGAKPDATNINLTALNFIGALEGNATSATSATTATTAVVAANLSGSIQESQVTGLANSLALLGPLAGHNTWSGTNSFSNPIVGTITGSIAESQVTGLVAGLALKAPLASPALTGVPTAPTASSSTNTTQIATTAMVQAAIATETPVTEIFGQVTIDVGGFEGNDSSHPNISVSSVCVASPMLPLSGTPNTAPWEFIINVSQSNISIILPQSNPVGQKQVYSYVCRP